MGSLIPLGFWAASKPSGGGAVGTDFQLISTTILGSTAASVTFSGLGTSAAAYKHLQIRYVSRNDNAGAVGNQIMRFNGDSGTNYALHELSGAGSSVGSGALANATYAGATWDSGNAETTNAFIVGIIDILDFASTSKNKTARGLSGIASSAGGQGIKLGSAMWNNTAAITSILLAPFGGNYIAGSRFSLYGSVG